MPKITDLTFVQPEILNTGIWGLVCYVGSLSKNHWNIASQIANNLSADIKIGLVDVEKRVNIGYTVSFDKKCPLIVVMQNGKIVNEITFLEIMENEAQIQDLIQEFNQRELQFKLNSKVITCKLYFHSFDENSEYKLTEIKRFRIACHMPFTELQKIVQDHISEKFHIKYKDDESETCTITNQFEFEEAIRVALVNFGILKLLVAPKSSKEFMVNDYKKCV